MKVELKLKAIKIIRNSYDKGFITKKELKSEMKWIRNLTKKEGY